MIVRKSYFVKLTNKKVETRTHLNNRDIIKTSGDYANHYEKNSKKCIENYFSSTFSERLCTNKKLIKFQDGNLNATFGIPLGKHADNH